MPTDLAIPSGLYGQLAFRSSLALKYWLDAAGGVIGNDYRDHMQIIIANEGTTEYLVISRLRNYSSTSMQYVMLVRQTVWMKQTARPGL